MQVAVMEQLQREKAEAAAVVARLEGELSRVTRAREADRARAAELEAKLAAAEGLRGERSAALATVSFHCQAD